MEKKHKMKCKEKECDQEGTGFFNKKIYCTYHYLKKREADKTKRNKNFIGKRKVCYFKGCDNILGYSNKSRLCSIHKEIEIMRIMLIERKLALRIALSNKNG